MGRFTDALGGGYGTLAQALMRPPHPAARRGMAMDRPGVMGVANVAPVGQDPLLNAYDDYWRGLTGQGEGSGWFGMNSVPQEINRLGAVQREVGGLSPEYARALGESQVAPGFGAVGSVGDAAQGAARLADDVPTPRAGDMEGEIAWIRSLPQSANRSEDAILEMARRNQAMRAERSARVSQFTSPIADAWTPSQRAAVENAAKITDTGGAEALARKATLDAIRREALRRGWTIDHVSKSKQGVDSSLYIEVPGLGRVRVSDHDLPITGARFNNHMDGKTGRWVGEIILNDWRTRSLDDYMNALMQGGFDVE